MNNWQVQKLKTDYKGLYRTLRLKWLREITDFPKRSRPKKLNSVAVVRKQTRPTERPPLIGEVSANLLRVEGVAWSGQPIPTAVNLGFLDRSLYFFIQVAPQLSSRGWVDPVPDPLLLGKSGRAGSRTRDLWICSQKLWRLDYKGGLNYSSYIIFIPNWDLLLRHQLFIADLIT
jgi:hypothetical protein